MQSVIYHSVCTEYFIPCLLFILIKYYFEVRFTMFGVGKWCVWFQKVKEHK